MAFIGYGFKHDFTKGDFLNNPGPNHYNTEGFAEKNTKKGIG